MSRTAAALFASAALVAGLLTSGAQAAVPSEAPSTIEVSPRIDGSDCEWGTEPFQVIPTIDYPAGYTGYNYYQDYRSPYECAIGPSWLPTVQGRPLSGVFVSSEEFNSFDATQHWCDSLADPTCSAQDWGLAVATLAMGHCDADSDFNCIESLDVIAPDGTRQSARYLRGFPEIPGVPEFRDGDTFAPAGGSVPLWEFDTDEGPVQLLSAGSTEKMFLPRAGRWVDRGHVGFRLILKPVTIDARPSLVKPERIEYVDQRTGVTRTEWTGWNQPDARGCFSTDTGECALEAAFPEGYRYRLSLRLRDEASLYLNGSIDNPVVFSTKISGGHRFVLEAAPSPVLAVAGWIPKAQVPRSLVDETFESIGGHRHWDMETHAESGQPLGRGGVDPLAWFKALLPYFGDRASFVTQAWYVENTPTQGRFTGECVDRGKGEFIGIVASNATAYTGDPPAYDATTSTLSYEIAGPHYMPDGTTLSKGRYSINMNADFVKCVLGVTKVPSVARVELIYPDGEESVATLALKQDRNWLRLVYENFTFSNPTVAVKFPSTLTCVKGKGKKAKTKKVVAFKCPKGWKPKR